MSVKISFSRLTVVVKYAETVVMSDEVTEIVNKPGGGRGNGTVAEDWRHQRKRLSFHAFQPDYSGIVPFES